MRDAILIAGVYLAAVIGAGFASGSEIVYYFLPLGNAGILGIFIACILFGGAAELILQKARTCQSFGDYVKSLMPPPAAFATQVLSIFFMAVIFVSMLSGGGEILQMLTGMEKGQMVLLLCVLSAIIFFFDLRGFVAVNNLLAIVIILGIVSASVFLLLHQTKAASACSKAITSGANYASYNMLTASVVLASLGSGKKLPKGICGVLSGCLFFLMLTLLWLVLRHADEEILASQLPMLTLCREQNDAVYAVYAAVLLSAMLTTAICNGFCVLDHLPLAHPVRVLLLACLGYCFAGLDFSFLVDRVYRAAGFLGYFFLLCIFGQPVIKKLKKAEK